MVLFINIQISSFCIFCKRLRILATWIGNLFWIVCDVFSILTTSENIQMKVDLSPKHVFSIILFNESWLRHFYIIFIDILFSCFLTIFFFKILKFFGINEKWRRCSSINHLFITKNTDDVTIWRNWSINIKCFQSCHV